VQAGALSDISLRDTRKVFQNICNHLGLPLYNLINLRGLTSRKED
jgi:hypothetical protein